MTTLLPTQNGHPVPTAVPVTQDGQSGHLVDGRFIPDNFLLDLARQVKYRQHDEAMESNDEH